MCHNVPYCAMMYAVPDRKDGEKNLECIIRWTCKSAVKYLPHMFPFWFQCSCFLENTHACFGTFASFDIGTCKSEILCRFIQYPPTRGFSTGNSPSPQASTRCICGGANLIHRLRLGGVFHDCCCEPTRLATAISFAASRPCLDQKLELVKGDLQCCCWNLLKLAAPNPFWNCVYFVFMILLARLWHLLATLAFCMRT